MSGALAHPTEETDVKQQPNKRAVLVHRQRATDEAAQL